LQDKLHDPGQFARDRKAFDDASLALTEAQGELAAAEEKWLTLEILREEIEG
jgi:ATP-binding cassette subfamily F protein uup